MTDKPPLRPLWRHSVALHELRPPPPWPAEFLTVRVGDLSEEAICSDKSRDKDDSTTCLPALPLAATKGYTKMDRVQVRGVVANFLTRRLSSR